MTAHRDNAPGRRPTFWRKRQPIVVVSGLPRSGTSMAMRMLEAGGMPIATDGVRRADESNVHGYYELEAVKQLPDLRGSHDTPWLKSARGKAIKIVIPTDLAARDIRLSSDFHATRFERSDCLPTGHARAAWRRVRSTDAHQLRAIYEHHLEEVARFLARRDCFSVMDLDYRRVLDHPGEEARRIAAFTGAALDIDAMTTAVDRDQYRSRREG